MGHTDDPQEYELDQHDVEAPSHVDHDNQPTEIVINYNIDQQGSYNVSNPMEPQTNFVQDQNQTQPNPAEYPPPQQHPAEYPPPQQQPAEYPPPQQQPAQYPPPQQQPAQYPQPQQQTAQYPQPQQQTAQYPPPQQQTAQYPPPQQQTAQYPPPQQQPAQYPPPQQQPAQYPPPQQQPAQYPPQQNTTMGTPPSNCPPAGSPMQYPPTQSPQPAQFPPPPSQEAHQPYQSQPSYNGPAAQYGGPQYAPPPIPQNQGYYNGTPFPVAQVGTQPWSSGLFDCMNDPQNAIITACFPCVTFGQIAEIIDNGHTTCATGGLMYGCAALIGVPCILSCGYRTKLRSRFGLIEIPAPDWVTHCLCEWCALCQEYRELNLRGLDPSIGWQGNLAKSNMQQQPMGMMPPTNQTMNY